VRRVRPNIHNRQVRQVRQVRRVRQERQERQARQVRQVNFTYSFRIIPAEFIWTQKVFCLFTINNPNEYKMQYNQVSTSSYESHNYFILQINALRTHYMRNL
jgi:hypothetical protein